MPYYITGEGGTLPNNGTSPSSGRIGPNRSQICKEEWPNKVWCRTRKRNVCRKDCKSWFALPAEKPLMKSCKKACKSHYDTLTKDDFMCDGDFLNMDEFFRTYGYDPCENDGIEIPPELDDIFQSQQEEKRRGEIESQNQDTQGFMMTVAIVVVLIIAGVAYLKFK